MAPQIVGALFNLLPGLGLERGGTTGEALPGSSDFGYVYVRERDTKLVLQDRSSMAGEWQPLASCPGVRLVQRRNGCCRRNLPKDLVPGHRDNPEDGVSQFFVEIHRLVPGRGVNATVVADCPIGHVGVAEHLCRVGGEKRPPSETPTPSHPPHIQGQVLRGAHSWWGGVLEQMRIQGLGLKQLTLVNDNKCGP